MEKNIHAPKCECKSCEIGLTIPSDTIKKDRYKAIKKVAQQIVETKEEKEVFDMVVSLCLLEFGFLPFPVASEARTRKDQHAKGTGNNV